MTVLGRGMLPLPESMDCFHVVSEIDPTDMTALEAVLTVDVEKKKLEEENDRLTDMLPEADEEDAELISDRLAEIGERLDELDAATGKCNLYKCGPLSEDFV